MREFDLQFFLKVGNLLITIPVNPEELEIVKELGYDSYTNLDKKEILKLQEEKLMEIEIESVLEQIVSSASVTNTPWTPQEYLNTFNGWKDNRTIVRVTSSDGQIDFEGYIVEVSTIYQGGTTDYNYRLKIVQERSIELLTNIDNNYSRIDMEYQVLRYTPPTNPTAPVTNTNGNINNQDVKYIVQWGDTLSGIAKMYYGDSSKWPDIYNANKHIISNPNIIAVGWELTIPSKTSTVKSSTSSSKAKSTTSKKSTSTTSSTSSTSKGQSGYEVIQGVEFWGNRYVAEVSETIDKKKFPPNGSLQTVFCFDSGTYVTYDTSGVVRSDNGMGPVVAVGYLSSYKYFGGRKIYDTKGNKIG